MSIRRLALCAALLFAAAPAFAAPDCGIMGSLTPDERLMHFADMQKATAGMDRDAKREYRTQERDKLTAMTPAQRQAYVADLDKRFQALSAADKQKLRDQAEAFRGEHPMMARMAERCAAH